jgi:hypothetical protein
MASDPEKNPPTGVAPTHHLGVKIFTYPKIIFMLPTLVAAIVCGLGMLVIQDNLKDPTKERPAPAAAGAKATDKAAEAGPDQAAPTPPVRRFSSAQNLLGVGFLLVFFLNMMIMAIDFPRFTIIALILAAAAIGFFVLWLNVYYNLLPPLVAFLEGIYAVANAGFFFTLATMMLIIFGIIWVTRYLDYWEILPNEILHNHGPFSDLERYPTFNLKFDKEIPDILEYALLRSGRLVLHVQNSPKAIVLDNVLWIDAKEEQLKKLMSRMEVRVTTDQETGGPI